MIDFMRQHLDNQKKPKTPNPLLKDKDKKYYTKEDAKAYEEKKSGNNKV